MLVTEIGQFGQGEEVIASVIVWMWLNATFTDILDAVLGVSARQAQRLNHLTLKGTEMQSSLD